MDNLFGYRYLILSTVSVLSSAFLKRPLPCLSLSFWELWLKAETPFPLSLTYVTVVENGKGNLVRCRPRSKVAEQELLFPLVWEIESTAEPFEQASVLHSMGIAPYSAWAGASET